MPLRNSTVFLWLAYVLFVIYGSLVPLDFHPRPLGEAWQHFLQTPFLNLGVESRADWISNGVLYIPVGFLTAYALATTGVRFAIPVPAFLFGAVLAVAVEFTQIFFPPRSVTLNDIFAEILGSLAGVVLAGRFGAWFQAVLKSLPGVAGRRGIAWLIEAYLVAYLCFSLFPFDFVVSAVELEAKIHSGLWGWVLAGERLPGFVGVLRLLVEVVLTMPLGWFLAGRGAAPGGLARAALVGALAGLVIEVLQFFMASGLSQGISVLTRMIGTVAGVLLRRRRTPWTPEGVRAAVGRSGALVIGAYGLTLGVANGWFSAPWGGMERATFQLGEVHFLPFYYHYFTSEAKALYSLASVGLMYAPVGVAVWVIGGGGRLGFWAAFAAAMAIEAGKLFLVGAHADPTNILVAAASGWLTRQSLRRALPGGVPVAGVSVREATPISMEGKSPQRNRRRSDAIDAAPRSLPGLRSGTAIPAGLALVLAGVLLAGFPFHPLLLGVFLVACAGLAWRRPDLCLAIAAAALPALDLAPWSGRFFVDEFDLLLLVVFPVAYLRLPPLAAIGRQADGWLRAILGLLVLSLVISTLVGLWPPKLPDANAFNNYYSPFNGLRIAKGCAWALVAFGLLRRIEAAGGSPRQSFAWGMVVGLAATVAVVGWERLTFSGLFNFASDYRVTGPFSAIHVGGAYIEGFLVVAVPFLLVLVAERREWVFRLAGIGLLLATTYGLMVTYARNGYLAFAVAVLLALAFLVHGAGWYRRRLVFSALIAGALVAAAMPVFQGRFAQERLAKIGEDFHTRQSHWADTLVTRDTGWGTALFGMGVGRFPETNFWRSREHNRSATYRLESERGNPFLRLTPGNSLYFEQFVSMEPNREYLLKVDVRASMANTQLTVPVCQKWMLTSYNCAWNAVMIGDAHQEWRHHEIRFNSGALGGGRWYASRPTKLAVYNGSGRGTIDIDNIRLERADGENILINGDFSQGLDRWFFATDSHLQWHAKSLGVAVLFDQGWAGVAAWLLFLATALYRSGAGAWRGDPWATAIFASLAGFLVLGGFDTLIDSPRFLLLLLLLGALGALRPQPPTAIRADR